MAPDSRMGSLEGENSNRRLQRVEEATTRKSTDMFVDGVDNIFIKGFHTG